MVWLSLGGALPPRVRAAVRIPTAAQATEAAQDREAFRTARAVAEPRERLDALLAFAQEFPESALRPRATALALETALGSLPGQTGPMQQIQQIHQLAAQQIADAPQGLERWIEEARVADELASAPPAGVDLPDALRWAQAALGALTPESFRRETAATQRRYHLPPLNAREMHRDYVRNRVIFLAALANVRLREAKPEQAEPLLGEAYAMDPLSSEVNELRGQLALSRHEDREALESLERAEATGALPAPWYAQMLRLYAENGGSGGRAGLEDQLDALYARLYPNLYTLPPRRVPAGGHTALLELFTGAGCEPCVAPDLAVESLLRSYGRADLAVLEYDENIPRPDPLTSPASETRAAVYRVGDTPEAFLDGVSLPVAGSNRGDVENVVVGFAEELEDMAAQPSPLRLTLQMTAGGGIVAAHGTVGLEGLKGLERRKGLEAPSPAGAALPGRPTVHVALVQDHMRYSGENGVRFHRMVVRALAPETPVHLPAPGDERSRSTQDNASTQAVEVRFNLQALDGSLRAYLDGYEQANERYGQVRFLTKDLPLDPAQLRVVMWVQDAVTHHIFQAASAVLQTASANAGDGR